MYGGLASSSKSFHETLIDGEWHSSSSNPGTYLAETITAWGLALGRFALARILSTILNRYRESGQPCLVPDFTGIVSSFSPFIFDVSFLFYEKIFLLNSWNSFRNVFCVYHFFLYYFPWKTLLLIHFL